MSAKSLENLLNPNNDGGLSDIVRHARDMGELVQMLQMSLTPEYAGSIVAANVRDDGELVILAASSAWASRLRFESEKLIEAASATGAKIESCTVRVSRDQ